MNEVEGVYKVELLGPYGWETFSTAFVDQGVYRGASIDHFTDGVYSVDGENFNMVGSLTKYADHRSLFGEKNIVGVPVKFEGKISNGVISVQASLVGDSRHSHRLRFNKLASTDKTRHSGGGAPDGQLKHKVHDSLKTP